MCLKCYLFTWDLSLNRPRRSCFQRHALRGAVLHDHSSIFVQISLTDAQEQSDECGAIKCYLDVTLLLRICSSRDQANLLFDHTIDFWALPVAAVWVRPMVLEHSGVSRNIIHGLLKNHQNHVISSVITLISSFKCEYLIFGPTRHFVEKVKESVQKLQKSCCIYVFFLQNHQIFGRFAGRKLNPLTPKEV